MTTARSEHAGLPGWQRPLLPGDLLGASRVDRSARDWFVDSALFAIAAGVGLLELVATSPDHGTAWTVFDAILGSIACLALWLRRRLPLTVALIAVSASIVASSAALAAPIAVFGVAVRCSTRSLVGIAALSLVAIGISPLLYPSQGSWGMQALVGLLATVVFIAWGLFTRVRRELVVSLRERAERLEAEQRWHVEQAREAERRRIAREMHDVLAHRLSLLSVHAGALEFRPDASPAEIAEAAGVIRRNAREALEDLRAVITLLREDADEPTPQPPQPTLAQIPALIEESRAAGMQVHASIDLPAGDAVAAGLGRTAYRVVQEALTNARKHAPGAPVEVTIATEEGARLEIEVLSKRPVATVHASTSGGLPGTGTGLVGVAERVALAGGELHYGPTDDGDFILRATLPWMR